MAIKTSVQCATYKRVGFTAVDHTYTVEGESRVAHVAIYDAQGSYVGIDDYDTCQFNRLAANTTYLLRTVYMDSEEEAIDGIVPDTEVSFTTKETSYYTPEITSNVGGTLSIAAMSDDIWLPASVGFNGFGIGVEVCDESDNILAHSSETPCTFENLSSSAVKVRAYEWTGQSTESSRSRVNAVPDTEVLLQSSGILDVFAFPSFDKAELHVRLQDFVAPSSIVIKVTGQEDYEQTSDIENKVYVVRVDELDEETEYDVEVTVTDGGADTVQTISFTTTARYTHSNSKPVNRFKDFYIAVGQPGAYSNNMEYDEVFGMYERFGIKIKHAPYSPMARVKNMVVQSWKDEDGDDVWLPRTQGSSIGSYMPAITHEAVDYNPVFVIFGDKDVVNSNDVIRRLLNKIEGRWLKVWDEYTHMGFEGVYLVDVDDDPKFKRRDFDYVQFTLKFKINGTNIDAPFEGIG